MFDINGGELLIIIVLAVVLIGPERLPQYAAQLARLVRRGKAFVQDARTRVSDELGPEFDDVDWSKLDPRQYDPRRIVREALLEDGPILPGPGQRAATRATGARTGAAATTGAGAASGAAAAGPAPYDDEAT
ncbi:Sec-independent protein translocase family protein [Puerhibacterium puerhi]|uniref:Sec-independent protein translocase TatB n=1 Tax=Puerhibacterium puerhi TaxID=2692623 RepID=UPI00135A9B81|nr:Sec-independent protein translocase TatB [Puerhibacterium puerhi]